MLRDQETNRSSQSIHTELRRIDYPPLLFAAPDDRVPLRLHFRVIWNRRWLILAMVLATITVVAVRTLKQKPIYKAIGTLEIEMPAKNVASIQDFFPSVNVPD